jgi:hypothetical protein
MLNTQVDPLSAPISALARQIAQKRSRSDLGPRAEAFIANKVRERRRELLTTLVNVGLPSSDFGRRLAAAVIENELWLYETKLRIEIQAIEQLIAGWTDPDAMRRALAASASGRESADVDVATRALTQAALSLLDARGDEFTRQVRAPLERHLKTACVPNRRSGSRSQFSSRRATSRGRPRERRGGPRRHAHPRVGTGDSGDSSDGESEPPGEGPGRRLCACGCGRDLSHKRADALTFDAGCRKRLSRAQAQQARQPAPMGERCVSCRCFLSRYGKGGAHWGLLAVWW